MPSTTLTIRLNPEVKAKLGRLSEATRRTKAFLAGEAVAAYVERELAVVEGIERGLRDVEAGRLVPHDEAMAELDRAIAEASSGKGDETPGKAA